MKYTSIAVLLAALTLPAWPSSASANFPQQCGYGYGCGGLCLNMFSKLHQHGPLFNYGPYYGYPPFEPYGPWNAYLQYNPWYYGNGAGGGRGLFGGHGLGHGCHLCGLHAHWLHGGWFRGHGCLSCGHGGRFTSWLHGLGGHGCHSCGHGGLLHKGTGGGCSTCTASADPHTTDAVARYTGAGDPAESAVFYAGFPTLDPTATR